MKNSAHILGSILNKEDTIIYSPRKTGKTTFLCSICTDLTKKGFKTLLFVPKKDFPVNTKATKIFFNQKALYVVPYSFDYLLLDDSYFISDMNKIKKKFNGSCIVSIN